MDTEESFQNEAYKTKITKIVARFCIPVEWHCQHYPIGSGLNLYYTFPNEASLSLFFSSLCSNFLIYPNAQLLE